MGVFGMDLQQTQGGPRGLQDASLERQQLVVWSQWCNSIYTLSNAKGAIPVIRLFLALTNSQTVITVDMNLLKIISANCLLYPLRQVQISVLSSHYDSLIY
jgi:hypothetical protein